MSALAARSSARVSRDATVQTHEVNTAAPLLRRSTGTFHAQEHTAMHGTARAPADSDPRQLGLLSD